MTQTFASLLAHDTPRRRTHRLRNGMSGKPWGEGEGSRAEAGLPVRPAQPLRPSLSPRHHAPAVRPFWALAGSVAAVAARRLDRG
jgi:hypothetical protein